MTDTAFPSLDLQYRMQRGDYATLCAVLARPTLGRVALSLGIWTVVLSAAMFEGANGDVGKWGDLSLAAATFQPPWIAFDIVTIITVLLFTAGRPWIVALQGAAIYKRNAIADQTVTLHFDDDGMRAAGAPGMKTCVAWGAIKRLVETRNHLFLLISRREGVIVPKRAFTDPADMDRLKLYVAAQIALTESAGPVASGSSAD